MPYWWSDDPSERFWCEITHRDDVGADLKCPQSRVVRDASGNFVGAPYWSYSLINEIAPGDVVFHYSGKRHAFIGASIAGGPVEERDIVWTARGSSARERDEEEEVGPKPGWRLPIYGFISLNPPLSLEELKAPAELEWILRWIEQGQQDWGKTYAPLTPYADTLRGAQGYLTKMPRAFVERWKPLGDGVERLSLVRQKIEDVVSPVIPQPLLEQVNLTFASALESVFRVPKKGTSDGNPGGTKGRRSKEAKKIGDRAEELVMRELRKCEEKGEIHRVTWRAQAGQTPGWDIDYLDATGALHAVEVKGTTGEVFTNIEISAQEWDQAARIRENYHLYLVTNCMTMSPCLYPITDPWGKCCSGLFNAEVALWRLRLP